MANISSDIKYLHSKILIGLPLTNPTGKIRLKKRIDGYGVGVPFASRQIPITEDCYVEWQIGYDTPDPSFAGCSKEISFIRKEEKKYGYELTSILYKGVKRKVFRSNIIQELINFAQNISEDDFIEENSNITRGLVCIRKIKGIDFNVIEEKYPLYFFDKGRYVIEVEIKHKQRAVGYQAMVYVCLPIKIFDGSLVGRVAQQKEFGCFEILEEKNNFICDTFKIFALASKRHNQDILNILKAIKGKISR